MDDPSKPSGICGTMMKKVKVKTDAHARDRRGRLVNVVRTFFGCSACGTICWVDMRTDGKKGDLYLDLQFEKRTGMSLIKDTKGNITGAKPKQ